MDWTKVPYYILDLIQQAPFVDVPGLGRFEAVLQSAVIDMDRSEARPPRRDAVFHPEEVQDRDLLSAFITFASGVSEAEAHEAILTFADEVARHTRNGSSFEIIRFGTFFRTPEDKIRFTPDWEAFNLSFNGLQPVSIPAPPAESDIPPRPAEHIAPEPESSRPHQPEPGRREVPADATSSPGPIPVSGTEEELSDVSVRMWWGILLSALVLIAVLCAYLAWDILSHRHDVRSVRPDPPVTLPVTVDTQAVVASPGSAGDTVRPGSVVDSAASAEPAATVESVPSTDEACFVVVGAFADTANAIRMESRLNDMGYVAERLSGKTLIRVAIKSSCDPVALQNVLDDARARIHPQAWIY